MGWCLVRVLCKAGGSLGWRVVCGVLCGCSWQTVETMESYQEEILGRQAELKEKLATTEAAAEEYHMQLLLSQERLEKLPTLDRIDTWMDAQNELFVAGNYGATLVEVATLLSSYDTFLLDLNSKKATLEGMTSEQEVITTRLAEVQEKLAATEECGAGYQQELYLSQERLEKLPALARVEAWLLSQNEVFAAGDYGDSLVAVATLLETFGNFARQLAPHKEVRTSRARVCVCVCVRAVAQQCGAVLLAVRRPHASCHAPSPARTHASPSAWFAPLVGPPVRVHAGDQPASHCRPPHRGVGAAGFHRGGGRGVQPAAPAVPRAPHQAPEARQRGRVASGAAGCVRRRRPWRGLGGCVTTAGVAAHVPAPDGPTQGGAPARRRAMGSTHM